VCVGPGADSWSRPQGPASPSEEPREIDRTLQVIVGVHSPGSGEIHAVSATPSLREPPSGKTMEGQSLSHYRILERLGGGGNGHRPQSARLAPRPLRCAEVSIWSLGVVLYEMLTSQLPFQGEHAAAVQNAVLNSSPRRLASLRSGHPLELERVALRALAKLVDERCQTMADFLAELRKIQRDSDRERDTAVVAASVTSSNRGAARLCRGAIAGVSALVVGFFGLPSCSWRPVGGGSSSNEQCLADYFCRRRGGLSNVVAGRRTARLGPVRGHLVDPVGWLLGVEPNRGFLRADRVSELVARRTVDRVPVGRTGSGHFRDACGRRKSANRKDCFRDTRSTKVVVRRHRARLHRSRRERGCARNSRPWSAETHGACLSHVATNVAT
jgi:hypothetical protein